MRTAQGEGDAKKNPLRLLQDRLEYQFKNVSLLEQALTHASAGAGSNYERLEFLGDRVISLVIARILLETFPDENEGDLAKRHAALVRGELLAKLAQDLNLGDALTLSVAERAAGGSENENILADGLEGVIGAVFLDGGLTPCARAIRCLWGDAIHIMQAPPQDPKTALQEWAQARGLPLPVYDIAGRTGPDHAPTFEISVCVQGYPPCAASGASRRKAEKEAAAMLLARLNEMDNS